MVAKDLEMTGLQRQLDDIIAQALTATDCSQQTEILGKLQTLTQEVRTALATEYFASPSIRLR